MKAVVIFSGGQDSTTCLHWAKNRFEEVFAITFSYGQKHSVELDQARKICEIEKIPQVEIDLTFLGSIVDSALIHSGDVNELNEKELPASFVPNRNQLFITLAHAYAQKIGASTLITGVCQTDYSGYPDCRDAFIKAIEWSSNLGSDSKITIETPLMWLTKAETFQLAEDEDCLEQVIKMSHTCYNGSLSSNEWGNGCADCPACELRAAGYNEFINTRKSIIWKG